MDPEQESLAPEGPEGAGRERRKRVGQALMEALELEGEAQRAYVERLRSEEPEVAEELEPMLAVEEMETGFLAESAAEEIGVSEASWREPEAPEPEDLGGESRWIGPYRLVELLGTGGMGKVYLAEQKEPLERKVALKLVRSTFRDEAARVRFEAEKDILQRLEHPNVGRILDAGTTDDGCPFFALEVISGEPIDRYCAQRELNIEQRLELMIRVCRGVEHAHQRRIIHRDLKPSNVLVSEIDGLAMPKIIDFGISESLDRRPDPADEAKAYGTPAYMSPEALRGSETVDTRTDVYSLGVLLYQLLVGFRPFDAHTLDDLLDQVSSQDPPAPSTRLSTGVERETALRIAEERRVSLVELRRTLRGDLSWILLKAIAKDVERRYDSVAALAADLARHLEGLPVVAHPPDVGYRAGKWLLRHRWPAVAATLLLAAGLGLAVQDVRSRARTERLTRAGQELTRQIERVEWRLRVAHLLPRQDLTPEMTSIRQGMAELRSKIPELYADNRGMAQYALGRAALSLNELETARQHLEAAWAEGYRRPEAALALGTTLGRLYEGQLDALSRVTDRATREALRHRAEEELRDPALEKLKSAEGDLALSELLLARMAFYRGELDLALEQSRAAAKGGAAFFGARFLQARILQRQSAARGLPREEALALLDRAEDAAIAGLEIARSSPEGHLRLCRIRNTRSSYLVRYSLPGFEESFAAGLEACSQVKEVLSSEVDADLESAVLLLNRMDVLVWDRHEDPAAELARLFDVLADLRAGKVGGREQRAEAVKLLGSGQYLDSVYSEQQGRDPRSSLNAAIELFREALDLGGGTHQLYRDLAHALASRGNYGMHRGQDPSDDFAEAERHARAAFELAPESTHTVAYLGQVLLRRAEHMLKVGQDPSATLDAAEVAIERAMELDPTRAAVLSSASIVALIRGFWLVKSGGEAAPAFQRALDFARRQLEVFPDSAYALLTGGQAWLHLARLEAAAGRDPSAAVADARDWLGRGLAKAPGLPAVYVDQGELALIEGRYALEAGRSPEAGVKEALDHAVTALEIDAERFDAIRLRGKAEVLRAEHVARRGSRAPGLFARAKASLVAALDADPEDAKNHLALARLAWRKSQAGLEITAAERSGSLGAARRAQELDPLEMEALALEGAVMMLDDETRAEGLKKVGEAVARNRNLAISWHRLVSP